MSHDGAVLIAFNKPYGVLSQFTADGSPNRTLANFHFPPKVYPLGRLDADSEGLLLLTDEARLNAELLSSRNRHWRTYWAQVEGIPDEQAIQTLSSGVIIEDRRTLPAKARLLDAPTIEPRNPPIRFRKTVPDSWLEIQLCEGRNRQVRRMTAAVGHPTLRLIRVRIGGFGLAGLPTGEWKPLIEADREQIFTANHVRSRPLRVAGTRKSATVPRPLE